MMVKRSIAESAKTQLTAKEICCTLWATRALSFDLIDDSLFRAQFGPMTPAGLTRHSLAEEMTKLAEKVRGQILESMKGCTVTLGLDGWTNTRHRYSWPCPLLKQKHSLKLNCRKIVNAIIVHSGAAHFLSSVEVSSNSGEQYYQVASEVKKMLEEKGIVVAAIVGDNASAVQNALER